MGLLILTGVMLWNMYRHVSTLRNNGSSPDSPAGHRSAAVPFDLAVPTGVGQPPAEPIEPTGGPKNNSPIPSLVPDRGHHAVRPPVTKPTDKKTTAASSTVDLSAYKVRAMRASGGDYLPEDESLSPEEIKEAVNHNDHNETDWGKGVIGDVVRGAQKIVKQADDATLGASRKALGTMASPDSAKVRPDSDGVRLHINIPTH